MSDVEELPWPVASCDTVTSTSVFHHFTRPLKTLAAMRRVLKSEGHLLLSNIIAPVPLRQMFNLLLPLSPERYVKIYSKNEIRAFLRDGGLKPVEWKMLSPGYISLWLFR